MHVSRQNAKINGQNGKEANINLIKSCTGIIVSIVSIQKIYKYHQTLQLPDNHIGIDIVLSHTPNGYLMNSNRSE